MKKLLLPLLLAPILVGCGGSEKDFGWKTVENNEYLEIHYGNTSDKYFSNDYIELKYHVIAYTKITEVYVRGIGLEGKVNDNYYVGSDLTVYQYEI